MALVLSARWAVLTTEVAAYLIPAAVLIKYSALKETRGYDCRGKIDGPVALLIAALGAAYVVSTSILVELAHSLWPIPEAHINRMIGLLRTETFPEFLAVMLIVAVAPAVAEELLFRGVIQPIFVRRFGPLCGIAGTALLFAAFHLNPWAFFPLLIVGTFFGYVAYKTGTFWAGSLAHFGCNVPGIIVANRTEAIGYEALTEGIPWYISAIAIAAATAGTMLLRSVLLRRRGLEDQKRSRSGISIG